MGDDSHYNIKCDIIFLSLNGFLFLSFFFCQQNIWALKSAFFFFVFFCSRRQMGLCTCTSNLAIYIQCILSNKYQVLKYIQNSYTCTGICTCFLFVFFFFGIYIYDMFNSKIILVSKKARLWYNQTLRQ